MSTGIYVAKTEWLIAQMEAEMEADQPRKLRYLLGELIVPEQASAYEYTGYLSNIHDIPSYFEANMDMLDPQKFMTLLHSKQKIYTKVKNEESTYFSDKSHVINSQFASGSVIHGEVIHSIVSRKCCIEESTSIAETILFPNVTIGQNVKIDYAIIDKDAVIKDGITIRGTVDMPVVIKKGQVVTEDIIL
jgi:glucose-1-phosphate adenylyltransferase